MQASQSRAVVTISSIVAAFSLVAGAFLSLHHPLWPTGMPAAFALWVLAAWQFPRLWLFALPAVLPVANLAPWTGWIGLDEFDLVLLGAIATGYLRLTSLPVREGATPVVRPLRPRSPSARRGVAQVLMLGFVLASAIALYRGLVDAGSWQPGWFQAYTEPLNSWRVSKPVAYLLLMWPMTRHAMLTAAPQTLRHVAGGMVAGLTLVSVIALWERAAYPGLLDFGARYRITAWFWELHVGGAAIDAYLALAAPFALWALLVADGTWRWACAAALALLAAYACLTTFSRGVYLGVGVPLLLLGACLSAQRLGAANRRWFVRILLAAAGSAALGMLFWWSLSIQGLAGMAAASAASAALLAGAAWHFRAISKRMLASALLAMAVLAEVAVVFSPGSFMSERLASGERDFGSRLAHWQNGLALLRSPSDALFGIGLGRLPAQYASVTPGREFSGAIRLPKAPEDARGVVVSGPPTVKRFAGLYGLTQRLSLDRRSGGIGKSGSFRISFDALTQSDALIELYLCEMHLLFPQDCQAAPVRLSGRAGSAWQHISAVPAGAALAAGPIYPAREIVFWLSVATAGAQVQVDNLSVTTADGMELLANRSFVQGMSKWLPIAIDYFVPWHVDNLYLELLIERGALALLCFAGLVWVVIRAASGPIDMPHRETAFFLAALCGGLLVGCVSSVMDAPRVSFLLGWILLLLFFGAEAGGQQTSAPFRASIPG